MSEAPAAEKRPRRALRLLRRLPLVGVVAAAAWLFSAAHAEPVLLRYKLPAGSQLTGLRAQITRGGELYRAAEWRYGATAPGEQLQRLELPPGEYQVRVQELGRTGPDPAPMPLHVDHGGDQEAELDLP